MVRLRFARAFNPIDVSLRLLAEELLHAHPRIANAPAKILQFALRRLVIDRAHNLDHPFLHLSQRQRERIIDEINGPHPELAAFLEIRPLTDVIEKLVHLFEQLRDLAHAIRAAHDLKKSLLGFRIVEPLQCVTQTVL